MQKISTYLYPNRVSVVADLVAYPVEWRIVYQRTLKIYQGMNNVIEFDIKNAEQRRIDITSYTLECVIMDENDQEVYTAAVTPIPQTTGLASMTVPASAVAYMAPQFLKYSVYIVSGATKTPLYGDTQFGAIGKMELIGGAVPTPLEPKIIVSFTHLDNDTDPRVIVKNYYSDAVEVNPLNDINEQSSINLEFRLSGLNATVTVQVTNYVVVSAATEWRDLETFTVTPSTERVFKTYNEVEDYSNNIGWLRIKYVPTANNTGKVDKIIVRM